MLQRPDQPAIRRTDVQQGRVSRRRVLTRLFSTAAALGVWSTIDRSPAAQTIPTGSAVDQEIVPLSHLFIDLFDRVDDPLPFVILDELDENNRLFFHDLNDVNDGVEFADRAARVRIRTGPDYRLGDHIRLLDRVRRSNTDTISIDPAVAADVNLNQVIFNQYLRQLGKAEAGLNGMNTAQAGNLVEHLG
jgi:hypothetical protein